ncbi:MAG: energy transducer TonB, partial [Acidobacteriota bacterium]
ASTTEPISTPAATTRAAGFGNTSTSSSAPASAAPTRSAGFGNSSVASNTTSSATIQAGIFTDARTADPSTTPTHAAAPPSTTPVQILNKPRPSYTDDARAQHIEGEVLLEIVFPASGPARVLRLIRGLGHGLDESATRSASAIEFRPALRAGQPIDQTAIVHIVFQLAN